MPSQRSLFLRHVAQTSPAPMGLEISRAEGVWLYDMGGKRYLDLIAGIGPSVLGHGHAAVREAVKTQADRFMHTLVYGEYVLAPQVQLAALLAAHLPAPLDCVYFTNSGAEATEGAMKLAKRVTGRTEIVAFRDAYHGSTQGAMSLMSDDYFTRAFRPLLPDVRHITFNHLPDLVHITRRTAGVILETVRAESGIHRPDAGYLEAVAARCREVGALLILDEIQAGYGRTGTLWAFEQYAGVVPDVLLLAKGMGGGMPLGAFVASQEAMQTLTHDPVLGHITTFGGHPVSVAAGVATLETIVALLADPAHRQRMATLEAKIKTTLQHPAIVAVRTAGLWAAVELGSEAAVQSVIHYALERGVITDWFLFNARALRIAPPLTISEAEFDYGLTVLREGIERLPTAI